MKRSVFRAALALSALVAGGCVRGRYQKVTVLRPVPLAAQAQLASGATLEHMLATLGAPTLVWEQPAGALALAYAWSRSVGWGVGVSVSVVRNVDASFDYDALAADSSGLVLWFDSDWRLARLERGKIGDLAQPLAPRRPNLPVPRGAALEGGP